MSRPSVIGSVSGSTIVYLKNHGNMPELLMGLTRYFIYYNSERKHQSLGYQTPNEVHQSGVGGGARIMDKFGVADEELSSVPLRSTEESSSSATIETDSKTAAKTSSKTDSKAKPVQRGAAVMQ